MSVQHNCICVLRPDSGDPTEAVLMVRFDGSAFVFCAFYVCSCLGILDCRVQWVSDDASFVT